MTVQQDSATPAQVQSPAAEEPAPPPSPQRGRPNLSGDLPSMLDSGPAFTSALRGYDRLQVDNYVAWAENELSASRRAIRELVKRLGSREAELQRAQQVLAQSPRSRELTAVSDRVAEMLRLAAEEADAARAAGAAEAADIVAQAHVEADLIKRRAQHLEAKAATRFDEAERLQAEARSSVDSALVEAEQIGQQAAVERQRLDEQAAQARARAAAAAAQQLAAEEERSREARKAAEAQAAARVADAEQRLELLLDRQESVREFLRRLTDQLDEALRLVTDDPAREFSFSANIALEPVEDRSSPQTDKPDVAHILANVGHGRRTASTTGARTAALSLAAATAPGRGQEGTPPRERASRSGTADVQRL
ncbi:hypothetical protein E9549_17445 [Blastococcus sp. MG754426]|uniref:DivIVA domain-containing protein n=1 Tax=unclassified Blastococcus TaxID=2619396 RepID=UPI001EF13C1C|nr:MULTISPECIES: DivIVA domain-containing protein [unclassified Blastococcus]MCF6509174.1 hypothetical protein [Blastococcus sp. MG754426]MCF6513735.1 hypothetical protein [Blastococcus sp. MG754427]